MKRIYVFTFVGSNFDNDLFQSDLRLLSYLMYTDICEYEQAKPLLVRNKYLVENKLIEHINDGVISYSLESDKNLNKYFFNPMILSENSFGITLYDDVVNDEEIKFILNNNKKLLSGATNYQIIIKSISYSAKHYDDESKREIAIDELNLELDSNNSQPLENLIRHKTRLLNKNKSSLNILLHSLGR